jgi:hypothetical protein
MKAVRKWRQLRTVVSRLGGGNSLSTSAENFQETTLEDCVSASLARISSPAVCHVLAQQGYAVVDGALGDDLCAGLRNEIKVFPISL